MPASHSGAQVPPPVDSLKGAPVRRILAKQHVQAWWDCTAEWNLTATEKPLCSAQTCIASSIHATVGSEPSFMRGIRLILERSTCCYQLLRSAVFGPQSSTTISGSAASQSALGPAPPFPHTKAPPSRPNPPKPRNARLLPGCSRRIRRHGTNVPKPTYLCSTRYGFRSPEEHCNPARNMTSHAEKLHAGWSGANSRPDRP